MACFYFLSFTEAFTLQLIKLSSQIIKLEKEILNNPIFSVSSKNLHTNLRSSSVLFKNECKDSICSLAQIKTLRKFYLPSWFWQYKNVLGHSNSYVITHDLFPVKLLFSEPSSITWPLSNMWKITDNKSNMIRVLSCTTQVPGT